MQYHSVPCNTMQYHAIPHSTMTYRAVPCNTMHYHAIPCNTVQYCAIPCQTMQYNAGPCNIMQYHGIPWNTMQYHASWITAVGAYHCPVGRSMVIFSIWHIFTILANRQWVALFGSSAFCTSLDFISGEQMYGKFVAPSPTSFCQLQPPCHWSEDSGQGSSTSPPCHISWSSGPCGQPPWIDHQKTAQDS